MPYHSHPHIIICTSFISSIDYNVSSVLQYHLKDHLCRKWRKAMIYYYLTPCRPYGVLMLAHRQQRWPSVKPALFKWDVCSLSVSWWPTVCDVGPLSATLTQHETYIVLASPVTTYFNGGTQVSGRLGMSGHPLYMPRTPYRASEGKRSQ